MNTAGIRNFGSESGCRSIETACSGTTGDFTAVSTPNADLTAGGGGGGGGGGDWHGDGEC